MEIDPLTPAFDPAFFIGTIPALGPIFKKVSDSLVELEDGIRMHNENRLGEVGKIVGNLSDKIVNKVTTPIIAADGIIDKLQGKIEQNLANQIGGAAERISAMPAIGPLFGGIDTVAQSVLPPPRLPDLVPTAQQPHAPIVGDNRCPPADYLGPFPQQGEHWELVTGGDGIEYCVIVKADGTFGDSVRADYKTTHVNKENVLVEQNAHGGNIPPPNCPPGATDPTCNNQQSNIGNTQTVNTIPDGGIGGQFGGGTCTMPDGSVGQWSFNAQTGKAECIGASVGAPCPWQPPVIVASELSLRLTTPFCKPRDYIDRPSTSNQEYLDSAKGFLATVKKNIDAYIPESFHTGISIVDGIATGIRNAVLGPFKALVGVAENVVNMKLPDVIGNSTENALLFSILVDSALADKYIGGPWEYISTPARYKLQQNVPLIFPSANEALNDYIAGAIDIDLLRNWVEINGRCFPPFEPAIQAAKSKPTPDVLIQQLRRKIISLSEFELYMRENGFIDKWQVDNIRKLQTVVPPASDLVRFMVRDVEDKKLVDEFGMMVDFDKKYQGNTKLWAEQNGMQQEYMESVWKAHWSIPAPGQLYEMYHRLSRLPPTDPRYVSIENVKTALEQQDILPYWIDKFLAISFRPITRVDARRAFEIGAMDRVALKNSYLDLGYDDKNAETLTVFNEKLKRKNGRNNAAVKAYISGIGGLDEMHRALIDAGFDADEIESISNYARKQFRTKNTQACVKSLKRRFFSAELGKDQTRNKLIDRGLDGQQADAIVEGWQCELDARGKELSASTILDLYSRGIINNVELVSRLRKLGYSEDNALLILVAADRKIGDKLNKQQEKIQKQLAAEQARQIRQAEAAAGKMAKDIEKGQKQAAAMQQANARRDSAIVTAAEKLARLCGIAIADAYDKLIVSYKHIRKTYGLSLDQSVQCIVLAVDKYTPDDSCAIESRIDSTAQIMLASVSDVS